MGSGDSGQLEALAVTGENSSLGSGQTSDKPRMLRIHRQNSNNRDRSHTVLCTKVWSQDNSLKYWGIRKLLNIKMKNNLFLFLKVSWTWIRNFRTLFKFIQLKVYIEHSKIRRRYFSWSFFGGKFSVSNYSRTPLRPIVRRLIVFCIQTNNIQDRQTLNFLNVQCTMYKLSEIISVNISKPFIIFFTTEQRSRYRINLVGTTTFHWISYMESFFLQWILIFLSFIIQHVNTQMIYVNNKN